MSAFLTDESQLFAKCSKARIWKRIDGRKWIIRLDGHFC
jgi:hypothetical protein